MVIRTGDKVDKGPPQIDGSFNVVMDIKHANGVRRFATNVIDPDAYYEKVRALMDNPPERDLAGEKEILLTQKEAIENEITKVEAEITLKEVQPLPPKGQ